MRRASSLAALALACAACGGTAPSVSHPTRPGLAMPTAVDGRPPVAAVAREGDARGGIAVAVTTRGIAPERGAAVGVALAALVEARIAARGIAGAVLVGGWDGWRLRATVRDAAEASRIVEAARAAMLETVAEGDPALAGVGRKLEALAHRPLADPALAEIADCTGEAYGSGGEPPKAGEIEAWRRQAHALGRVALAAAGDSALADAVTKSLRAGPEWSAAASAADVAWPADAPVLVYDASGEIAPAGARVIVTARTAEPERAVAAASVLGAAHGPLAARLAGLEAPARVRSVLATAHANGGCVAVTLDLAPRDLASDAPARIATAAALARQELAVEMADTPAPPTLGRDLATQAVDPAEAAERAAWWTLASVHAGPRDALLLRLTVGTATAKDGSSSALSIATAVRAELDRATLAWQARAVDGSNVRVEHGQGEMWLLLASPCGTVAEAEGDAGSAAVVAAAAAEQASEADPQDRFEAFVAADGVGVLAHGAARPGESPGAQARRLADVASRAFAAEALEREAVQRARAQLLATASRSDARALTALAGALAPGHPAWVVAEGTEFGLGSASDEAIALRASSLRAGPLKVAVLANSDASQAEAAVRAVDRWIARPAGRLRACPDVDLSPPLPHADTYAVALPAGARSEVLLAYPVAADEPSRLAAEWLAAAIDGTDGILSRALAPAGAVPAARAWRASVVGAPLRPALTLRIEAPEASLDAAVTVARAEMEKLRQGSLRDEDRARAADVVSRAALRTSLDPRLRAVALWHGVASVPPVPPSLDVLRTFAASTLREDNLVVVAARPPRLDPEGHPFSTRDPKAGAVVRDKGGKR